VYGRVGKNKRSLGCNRKVTKDDQGGREGWWGVRKRSTRAASDGREMKEIGLEGMRGRGLANSSAVIWEKSAIALHLAAF
jgi:hypothetical protein